MVSISSGCATPLVDELSGLVKERVLQPIHDETRGVADDRTFLPRLGNDCFDLFNHGSVSPVVRNKFDTGDKRGRIRKVHSEETLWVFDCLCQFANQDRRRVRSNDCVDRGCC